MMGAMTETVRHQLVYPGATLEAVQAMLMTPAFREAVCDRQRHLTARTVTIDGSRVTVDQRQSTGNIPGFARKFAGDELQVLQEETWTSPTHGDITVTIPGKPGDISGTADLEQVGSDVVETVVLSVSVGIPLIGNKIAGVLGDKLLRTLKVENEVGLSWLSEGTPR